MNYFISKVMQFRLKTISFISLLLFCLLFVACQGQPSPSMPVISHSELKPGVSLLTPLPATPVKSVVAATPAPAPVAGGEAVVGLIGQPQSLNPITESSTPLQELTPLLFDTLLDVNPHTAELRPRLAEHWFYRDDNREVVFQLQPNLKWSDGAPLTAGDIVESLEATRHPALLAFSNISAPDDETLVFTFASIDCSAVTTMGQLPLLPAGQIADSMPLGSGPFRVADWSPDQNSLRLIRNPYHTGELAYLDGIKIRFFEAEEAETALSEGQFDAIGPFSNKVNNPDPAALTDIAYLAPEVVYVAMNFAPSNGTPMSPLVRQALTLALDRETILSEALARDGQLATSAQLPRHWAANPDIAPPQYDPEQARALLASAGLTDTDGDGWLDQDGERLDLSLRLNGKEPLYQDLGWLVSSYYRDLGLYARAESTSSASLIDDLFTHDFELAIFRWPILPDPDQRLYWRSDENQAGKGLNFTSYNNPQVDKLLDQGVSIPGCEPQDRAKTYAAAQEMLNKDRPVDFLLIPHRHLMVTDRLAGFDPGPFAPFTWNAAFWHLRRDQ